jgi:hypothetical protein
MRGNTLVPDKKKPIELENELEEVPSIKKNRVKQKITQQEKLLKGPVKKEKHRISVNDILDELEEDGFNFDDNDNDEY